MAQASSVPAREPSMEEILASIRRIIEDSDHASPAGNDAQQQASAQPAEADNTASEAAPEADFGPDFSANDAGAADLDAFRSELGEADPLPSEPVEPALEPQAEQHAEPPVSFDASGSQIGFDKPVESPAEPDEEAAQPTFAAEPPAPEPEPEPAQPEPAASNLPQRTSIISETAERQVAAAFGELSDVFAASQKRSFDEIAEELMRPMLQDWLDNNLPVLVERLVREEIERVARGATR